jgi:ubiquitin C-terminal hydrolase
MNNLNGLTNLGNTCFFNATLQLLYQCTILNKLLMSNNFNGNTINSYVDFLKSYSSNNSIITPHNILYNVSSKMGRIGSSQEDAEQYLNYIIDNLITELITFTKQNNIIDNKILNKNITLGNLINNIFTINIKKTITCLYCSHISQSDEIDNKLYLAINNSQLDKILLNYTNEQLDENNKYKCEKCNNKSCAKINKEIIKMPKYLIIALKRYTNSNNKINNPVIMNKNLSINNNNYEMRGFIYHSGITNGGHYVYYGKRNNDWYLFNDNSVSKINIENLDIINYSYIYLYNKI